MCICINCIHVCNCNTYALIQRQHGRYAENILQDFIPVNTLIKISISSLINVSMFDWDLQECSSFTEKPGNWLIN
uniref:Uncharacterized protein n=1 Tax=Rhodymenia pseudopalmata TaxID=31502 RepID=A0A1C9C7I9_RHOPU|nr:hypothetical protein Rhodyp_068 [Rhodymenia pseudopalmata]AOM64346.1 hypothetical protein Rhodyp_068 [Rhodymenia pseudopalmata]